MNKYYAVAKYSPFNGELELEFVFAKDEMSAINTYLKTEYTWDALQEVLENSEMSVCAKEVKDPKNWRNFTSKNGYNPNDP